VHRDIKPGNIVYADDGRVRVLDFGITQLTESTDSQALTATHTVMGTAEYLAPEQALGGRVDGRADLYALGCVLYALLAGQPPFKGATPVATMMMHANDPVPDVRTLRPETPDWLADLVHSLLAKDPDDRPAGAATVAAALASRESLGGAATTVLPAAVAATTQRLDAVPPPPPLAPPTGAGTPVRRETSPWVWVLGTVAVVAIGLLLWALLSGDGADPTSTPSTTPSTSQPAQSSQAPPTTQKPSETPTPTPSDSPSPTADPADAVRAALSAFSDEVAAVAADGLVDKDAAKKLDDGVRALEKALRDGDPQKVSDARDKLVQDYDQGVQDGTITADAKDRLDPPLADLNDSVDAYVGG
jgi:serine/threonine-protein kinase